MIARDNFGEELQRGDTIIYLSYDAIAKGKIIDIEEKKGLFGSSYPMLLVEKIAGTNFRKHDGVTQLGRLTRLDRVVKI